MKKIILVLFLIILNTSIHAQLKFGVNAGINYSQFYFGSGIKTPEGKMGSHIGIFGELNPVNKIVLKAELLYSLKGFRTKSSIDTFKTNLHYANLPLLVGYKTKYVNIFAGLEFGYLFEVDVENWTGQYRYFNKEDVGLVASVQVPVNGNFSLESRYVYGLSKPYIIYVADRNGVVINKRNIGRNEVFQLSFLYNFSKKITSKKGLSRGGTVSPSSQ